VYKLAQTFHSGEQGEESEMYNQNVTLLTLRIHALSKIACTMCPVRRLLVHNSIEFSANDGLSKLRRELKTHITVLKRGKMTELNIEHHSQSPGPNTYPCLFFVLQRISLLPIYRSYFLFN
jgi:hypothetical protein